MHGFTAGVAQDVTRLVDASAAKLAVDIGGASGTLVHSLMSANPQLRGIILDLPDVVPSAIAAAAALGLTGGPVFANVAAKWVHSGPVGVLFDAAALEPSLEETNRARAQLTPAPQPSLTAVLTTILLPLALMMSRSLADAFPSWAKFSEKA